MANTVRYKCPFCSKRMDRQSLVKHVAVKHEMELPEGFTPMRYVFNYVNRKPIDYHGVCTECKGPTDWDENKGRYNRQCNNPACKKSFIKNFEENMKRTKGYTRMTATKDGLEKMLAARRISGQYKMQDGEIKTYTGSYELKALQFMDQVMNIKSQDIMCPGPILDYEYQGKTHVYITDFYYVPYNLIIEVKDGGNHPNTRNMADTRARQIAKEHHIIEKTNYNYLRLVDNDLSQLLSVFMALKMQMVENTNERVIQVNENMIMGDISPVIGPETNDAYIVNYMQNNVFSKDLSPKYCIVESPLMEHMLIRDSNGILKLVDRSYLESMVDSFKIYKTNIPLSEVNKKLGKYVGKFVSEEFVYETLFGKKLLSYDQIGLVEGCKEITNIEQECKSIQESIYNYIMKGEKNNE